MASLILGDKQTLKTENNGKNWELSLDGATDYITLSNGEKLICLNSGLFLLDLDGILKNLNIKDPFKIYVDENDKVTVTTKNGDIYAGYPPKFNQIGNDHKGEPTADGIIGEDGVLDNNGNLVTSEDSLSVSGNIYTKTLKIKNLKEEDVDKVTVYILNNILYPYISKNCVGYKLFPLGEITAQSNNNKTIYIKTTENFFKQVQSSFINWQEDVGMEPINNITLGDLFPEEEKTYVQTDTIDEVKYLEAKEKTLKIIEEVKKTVQKENERIVTNIDPGLLSNVITKSPTDALENNISAYKEYVTMAQQTNLSFLNMITERIYTFDEYSLRKLIKNSVYECVNSLSGYVKVKLLEAIRNKEEYFDVLSMPFKYNYRNSVIKALSKYSDEIKSKTKEINSKNDKDLISLAAQYYNSVERENLIYNSVKILSETISSFDYKNIATKYNACVKNINDFLDGIKKTQNVKNYYETFNFLYKDYDFSILNDIVFNKIYETYKNKMLQHISNRIINKTFYENTLLSLSEIEQKNTLGYIKEIMEKFVDRCLELLLKCYNEAKIEKVQIIKKQDNYLSKWVKEYSENRDKKYFNDYHAPKLEKQTKLVLEKNLKNIFDKFNTDRGIL